MPEVSRFFGIAIRFYYNDHEPAHFHAVYCEHEALIEIASLAVLRGELPRPGASVGLEWAALHRAELLGPVRKGAIFAGSRRSAVDHLLAGTR